MLEIHNKRKQLIRIEMQVTHILALYEKVLSAVV